MGIAAIALVGVFVAMYLTLYKVGVIGELSCSVGSCETVNLSRWSIFLGLPVAAWGLGFYVAMLVVSIIGTQPAYADSRGLSVALVAMSGWGVLFSGWLSYLEARVINAWCMWCVASACLVVLLFVMSVLDLRATRSAPA